MATLQKAEIKDLTDAIFFYVASTKENDDFELPEEVEEDQIKDFAERIIEHLTTRFEVPKDEANEKTERLIADYLAGRL